MGGKHAICKLECADEESWIRLSGSRLAHWPQLDHRRRRSTGLLMLYVADWLVEAKLS